MASKPFQASPASRTAGRFVAANYGKWSLNVFSFPAGTGTLQFAVTSPLATLTDGRQLAPFNTNAPIYVGSEKVTPTAVVQSSANPGGYLITASFSNAHGAGETVSSATFGLQEALNDANASGGGAVVIDSAWAALGGTTTIKNAATVPSGTGVEDVRTGLPSAGTGTVTSVSVTTANGVSGTVATATTTPAISLTLGDITPNSVVPTTPIAVANGGSGAATAAAALTNLGGASLTAANNLSAAGALSTPGLTISGAPITGGTGTTTAPQVLIGNGTAPTSWSTGGTQVGINTGSGVTNAIDVHANGGSSVFSVSSAGNVAMVGSAKFGANYRAINSQSGTSYTVTTTDGYVHLSNTAARAVTLPQTANAGQIFYIVDSAGTAGTGNITVTVATSGTINGAANKVMSSNYAVNAFQWVSSGVYLIVQ